MRKSTKKTAAVLTPLKLSRNLDHPEEKGAFFLTLCLWVHYLLRDCNITLYFWAVLGISAHLLKPGPFYQRGRFELTLCFLERKFEDSQPVFAADKSKNRMFHQLFFVYNSLLFVYAQNEIKLSKFERPIS